MTRSTPEATIRAPLVAALNSGTGLAGAHAMLAQLDARQIALADPRENWSEKLRLLQSRVQLAKGKKI